LAALLAALGALPFLRQRQPPAVLVGCAYAVASGVMIGGGYLLGLHGLDRGTLSSAAGAVAGIAYSFLARAWTDERQRASAQGPKPAPSRYGTLLQSTLHSASEGLAIGVAMAVSLPFGIFMALALGLHNVAEAMVLTDLLRRDSVELSKAAALAVATNLSQPLVAVTSVLLLATAPALLPAGLGFAAGAMLFLVLAELAPEAYDRAGRLTVALIVSAAAALVLLLEHLLL
jgi:zinc transporter ZupT